MPATTHIAAVAVGTVRSASDHITIDADCVSGQWSVGKPRPDVDDQFADDMNAVRSDFDRILVRKGLVTRAQLELIRSGTRSGGTVTGVRATDEARENYRGVEIDLVVRRPEGGRFPAHETGLVPESALLEVTPGSVVDLYYRRDDETAVAVCVPPD